MITEDHLHSLKYFWETKEDLERYTHFESIKEELKLSHPKIIEAWENHKRSIKELTQILEEAEPNPDFKFEEVESVIMYVAQSSGNKLTIMRKDDSYPWKHVIETILTDLHNNKLNP